MIRSSIKIHLEGNNYKNIVEKVNSELANFLNLEVEEISRYVDCEIICEKSVDKNKDVHYSCEVIAKVRNYDV